MFRNSERRRWGRPRRARTTSAVVAALLAGSVVISGCGAAGEDVGASADSVSEQRAPQDRGVTRDEAGGQSERESSEGSGAVGASDTADTAKAAERHVIRTAELTVETENVQDGLDEARTAVTTAGGYVEQEYTDRGADGEERSRVTFKVPPEEYQEVLDTLVGIGDLVRREASAKDVTGEVVDVESRIRTQRASVARVRELMDDATQLSDVVTLESELSSRQADLEALQARLESLESRSGMATVTLELVTPHAATVDDEEDTTVGGAVADGWDAFVTMLKWIAIAVGSSLPFVAALALVYGAWRAVRGRVSALSRRRVVPPPPVGAPAPVKDPPGDAG